MKKLLAVGVIVLFLCVSVIPSIGTTVEKKSTICKANNPPYIPCNPSPANDSTGVSINTALSWNGGDPDGDPITYNVYFGTTSPPLQVSWNQSANLYYPGILISGTTYYWRIVAWDNHGAFTKGPLWKFTTVGGPPPHLKDVNVLVIGRCRTIYASYPFIPFYHGKLEYMVIEVGETWLERIHCLVYNDSIFSPCATFFKTTNILLSMWNASGIFFAGILEQFSIRKIPFVVFVKCHAEILWISQFL